MLASYRFWCLCCISQPLGICPNKMWTKSHNSLFTHLTRQMIGLTSLLLSSNTVICSFSCFSIEKSRQIFPAMIEAAENCPNGSQLNWKYFFELLFTRKNLKLVHIGCHFKGEHEGCECARRRFYTKKRRWPMWCLMEFFCLCYFK